MSWQLTLVGLGIGVLVGMTGMGGGSLMTPVLVLGFGFPAITAVGTDVMHGAFFKTIGAWRHRVLGHVHARLTFWFALGSVPASIGGVFVLEALERVYGDDVDDVALKVLGAALILASIGIFLKAVVTARPADVRPYVLAKRDRVRGLIVGVVGGFVLGMTSVGSGTFFGLMLIVLFPLTAPKVVGTDLFHASILLWAAGIAHLASGNVDLNATGWLALGSIPGILSGSQLTVRLPERVIRAALGLVLFVSGVKLAGAF